MIQLGRGLSEPFEVIQTNANIFINNQRLLNKLIFFVRTILVEQKCLKKDVSCLFELVLLHKEYGLRGL